MVARIASTFSLLLLLVALGHGQAFTSVAQKIQTSEPAAIVRACRENPMVAADPEIADELKLVTSDTDRRLPEVAKRLKAMVEIRAMGEGEPDPKAIAVAKEIKSAALYRDDGIEDQSNWLGRALSRLENLRWNFKPPDSPKGNGIVFGDWLITLVWAALAVVGLVLLYFALRHVNWQKTLARKAKAMLEEDEPERTLDEWLAQADALAAEGRHREAVRALYLACLLRFDENRVARFVRGETNWEHLARIQASPRRPVDLDFRPATKAFDQIWYGRRVNGQSDVDRFRNWYQEIVSALTARAA